MLRSAVSVRRPERRKRRPKLWVSGLKGVWVPNPNATHIIGVESAFFASGCHRHLAILTLSVASRRDNFFGSIGFFRSSSAPALMLCFAM